MRYLFLPHKAIALALVVFSSTLSPAISEGSDGATVFDVNLKLALLPEDQKIEVIIRDQATDGCWTNSSGAKTAIEKNLIVSGYKNIATAGDTSWFQIEISALGFETGGGNCAIYTGFRVISGEADRFSMNDHELLALNWREQFSSGTLLTGSKSEMTRRINETLYQMSDEFIVAVNAARNELRKQISESSVMESQKSSLLSAFSLN
ncbi:hypothetical protein [Ruegeria arenilitoris]|uniref:hypothetical protein n=1 Tax=Ruegeria arenilitoris TaxID=1173585 RepID=UPI00147F4039|nr:hypothetical protein [Ruegeria arenilitoris]